MPDETVTNGAWWCSRQIDQVVHVAKETLAQRLTLIPKLKAQPVP
jgi:hypothetical protein